MSRYESERGSIVIPSREWANLKKEVREAYNKWMTESYTYALQLWKYMTKHGILNVSRLVGIQFRPRESPGMQDHIERELHRGSDQKLTKPRKSAFPLATIATKRLAWDEWRITFDNETRTVHWSVRWNNHAVDEAHRHPAVIALFSKLDRLDYSARSGGVVRYNNEYISDNFANPTVTNYSHESYVRRHNAFRSRR